MQVVARIFTFASQLEACNASLVASHRLLYAVNFTRSTLWWHAYRALQQLDAKECQAAHERPGRPYRNWEASLVDVFGPDWLAESREDSWKQRFGHFQNVICGYYKLKLGKKDNEKAAAFPISNCERSPKPPTEIVWQPAHGCSKRLVILGDSLLTVQWLSGCWKAKYFPYQQAVATSQNFLSCLCLARQRWPRVSPSSDSSSFWVHQYREHNRTADELANKAAREGTFLAVHCDPCSTFQYLAVQFDGSWRDASKAASACALWARRDMPHTKWRESQFMESWCRIVDAGIKCSAHNALQTELLASTLASCTVLSMLYGSFEHLEAVHQAQDWESAMQICTSLLAKSTVGF